MVKTLKTTGSNALCSNCVRSCKQAEGVLLLECPRFIKRPFKVANYRYDQLDLFAERKK